MGQCRTPRVHGSKERANHPIKKAIGNMVRDKRLMLKTQPNLSKDQQKQLEEVSWVTEYPFAIQSVNQ
jgi:hypothetical protein